MFSLSALFLALGALLLLELVYLYYRRGFQQLVERLRYQSWAVAVALLVYLVRAGGESGGALLAWIEWLALTVSVDLAYRLLDRFWLSRLRNERGRFAVPQLVRDLAGWVIVVGTGLAAGYRFLDWDLGRWALPSAVVSAVLGFALQDVLKNVFAGLALQTEAPFETGDWLLVDEEPRQVLEMTWRSTRLRDNLGHDYIEPNAMLAAAQIVNLGAGDPPMGFEVEVTLPFAAPPGPVKESLERAGLHSPAVVSDPAPVGLLVGFSERGTVFRLRFWSRQVFAVARLLDEVRTRIWYQLERDGWQIPYPVTDLRHAPAKELAAERRLDAATRAAELFARVEVLAPLPDEVRQQLAASAHLRHFDRREKLVTEGDHAASLFVLSSGNVLISKSGTDIGATSVKLATLGPGDYFGEMSLLTGAPRSATVSAEGPVEAFEIDRAALAPILQSAPQLAEVLSRVLAERVAATVARFEDRRDELSRRVAVEESSILTKIRHLFRLG